MERAVFYVGSASTESFGEFIGTVDDFFMSHAVVIYRGVPLTCKQSGWLPISLELDGELVDLAIDPTDGYLSAFREGEHIEEKPWYCFKECRSDGLGGETRMLSIESGYCDLVDLDWDGVSTGIPALQDTSVYRLLKFLKAHRDVATPDGGFTLTTEEKRALARIIFMICEPSRLRSARIFVSHAMSLWYDTAITRRLKSKINGWSKISRFALHCVKLAVKNRQREYNEGDTSEKELKAVKAYGIKTLEDAIGPDGELLLVKCRDYEKDDKDRGQKD